MANYSEAIKEQAKLMYFNSAPVSEIIKQLNINSVQIIYKWINDNAWDKLPSPENAKIKTSVRYNFLLEKDDKTANDLHELERLADILIKFEKAECDIEFKKNRQGTPSDTANLSKEKNPKEPKKHKKNSVDHITEEMLAKFRDEHLYKHQRIIYDAGQDLLTCRNRIILKPRQVGGTFGLAFEAFETAILKQHNQIFISATRAQAEVFKSYIAIIAAQYFDAEISGSPSRLSNSVELHYLSPNSNAQSRSGDVYFDEIFWTPNWLKMESYASPMATQKMYKKTYISTPSTVSHQAYEYWSGDKYNKNRPQKQRVDIDINDMNALKTGRLDGDGFWRFAFTVHDAVEWGFDRVDIEQLRLETDPAIFPCLFECKFIDDTASVFSLKDILACAVDTKSWGSFDKNSDRPYQNLPVSIGYDPAGDGDNASGIVLSRPKDKADKFRLLEKHNWRGQRVTVQCEKIEDILSRYNVEDIFVDATGPGIFVGDLVQDIFPSYTKIQYNPEEKGRMVQKCQSVIKAGRFEYDENDKTLPLAFMTVYQKVTNSGIISYDSTRNSKVGHGDEAWATMQAMMCEPLHVEAHRKFTVTTFD